MYMYDSRSLIPSCPVMPVQKMEQIMIWWGFMNEKQLSWSGTVNREIFAVLKVGEFAFFQLAVDRIPRLLQKFNG
jgi:hypothetical protein